MSFGFAQGMGDFFGGFNDESGKIRDANAKKNSEDSAIEQRALEHLANADDPQIRAAAVTAMLTPKKSAGGGGVTGLLGKWYGQQRDHPVFDQVHQLMNGGQPGPDGQPQAPRQAFLSPEDKADAEGRGRETGRIGGANDAYKNVTGEDLPNEDLRRAALGSVGAPPPRALGTKPGVITLEDGTTVAGSYDPATQMYTDSDGTTLSGVKDFHPNGTPRPSGNPNPGSRRTTVPDHASPTGYMSVSWDANGKELNRVPTAAPQAPPNAILQTPTGLQAVAPGRLGGAPPQMLPVQGGNVPTKTEEPSAAFTALRQTANDVEARAKASVAHFGALPPNDVKLAAARDREAKVAGYANWQALQDALHAAQTAIGGAVQQPGAPPAGIDAGAAAPAAAPATPPASPKPGAPVKPGAPKAKPQAKAGPGKIDVNAVLAELAKFD